MVSRKMTVPYAGMIRIRFDGSAFTSQPRKGHPNGFAILIAPDEGEDK